MVIKFGNERVVAGGLVRFLPGQSKQSGRCVKLMRESIKTSQVSQVINKVLSNQCKGKKALEVRWKTLLTLLVSYIRL